MSESTIYPCPLSLDRRIEDFPIGNIPLHQHHGMLAEGHGGNLKIHPQAWIDASDALLLVDDVRTLLDGDGAALAWLDDSPDLARSAKAISSFFIRYPWDFLRANEQFVSNLTGPVIEGDVHASAVIDGIIHLGSGTRILPGVYIEGNAVIGANCKIGPNCYIRGNTSIGDGCHIGQSVEIKNCLILSKTNVGHLSYVGDSVLGEKVNFGAGTTTSNLRHDGKNHLTEIQGQLIDTGRRKFGAIVGDHVHTGINTSIYPGRKLWPGTTTRPGDIVQRDVVSRI
jgi:UDP-N-acetylglucosamine diphosphorylase / glucose-1-phosphate thymidylyltransferase / UDP-N-acetylgalactosamine diphosphorylase / glucosamine-1-phosphate N-acetyltransferase / galactosamine-1-phosphate N-acetyltransferase